MHIVHTIYNKSVTSKQNIQRIIHSIGGDEEVADLYYALVIFGPQTISQLAKNAQVERTKVYRLLETMQALRLIEIELHPNRNIIRAALLSSVLPIIAQKQRELKEAAQALPRLETLLNKQTLASPLTRVQFYQGQEGVKQMLWNQTKAEGETLSILYENMQSHTGEEFYVRWAERCNERGLTFRSVVGDEFMKSQQEWSKKKSSGLLNNWHGKYITSDEHTIRFWTCLYNDVVAYFNWYEYEIYGIEIYNQDIADANRNFFDMLWEKSQNIPSRVNSP